MLCTSDFVDDVILSFDTMGVNGPESKMTYMFRHVRQVAAPGAKFAVFECILLSFIYNLICYASTLIFLC